jgi:hypothetical protein
MLITNDRASIYSCSQEPHLLVVPQRAKLCVSLLLFRSRMSCVSTLPFRVWRFFKCKITNFVVKDGRKKELASRYCRYRRLLRGHFRHPWAVLDLFLLIYSKYHLCNGGLPLSDMRSWLFAAFNALPLCYLLHSTVLFMLNYCVPFMPT